MRFVLMVMAAAMAGCTMHPASLSNVNHQVLKDIESYAIASCLCNQADPYLKQQGDAWASAIIQRTNITLETLTSISAQIDNYAGGGQTALVRSEAPGEKDKSLPLMFCYEIVEKSEIRAAIQGAVSASRKSP